MQIDRATKLEWDIERTGVWRSKCGTYLIRIDDVGVFHLFVIRTGEVWQGGLTLAEAMAAAEAQA